MDEAKLTGKHSLKFFVLPCTTMVFENAKMENFVIKFHFSDLATDRGQLLFTHSLMIALKF